MITLKEIRSWLRNEPIYRVQLARGFGQFGAVNYVEAVDEADARSIFDRTPGATVLSVRRATIEDAPEVRATS